jgi:hypothetical protein
MSTARKPIRPRLRTGVEQTSGEVTIKSELAANIVVQNEKSSLPVLARIPQVSTKSDRTKLSMRLDWLARLDWKRMRHIKMDPSWVAGGVLCVVLFLLLLITINRSSKTGETREESDAPTWKSAASTVTLQSAANTATTHSLHASVAQAETLTQGAAQPNADFSPAAVPANRAVADTKGMSIAPSQPAGTAEGNAVQPTLAGIYYPRTPYPAPAIGLVQTRAPSPGNFVAQPREYVEHIRTAQRDGYAPHAAATRAPVPSPPVVGGAQLDGIITKP